MAKKKQDCYFDRPSNEWFKRYPGRVTSFMICKVCGLGYITKVQHECPGTYTGENAEFLAKIGLEIQPQNKE